MTRAEGSYNEGYADNLSFRLDRPGWLHNRQAKIWLNPDKPSALPGQSITSEVILGYSPDAPTLAEQDVRIDLKVKGAEVDPTALTIPRGSSSVAAAVRLQQPGRVEVSASSRGLVGAEQHLYSCDSGAIKMIEFDTTRQSEAADGTGIPFSVVLTDSKGHVVTDHQKIISLSNLLVSGHYSRLAGCYQKISAPETTTSPPPRRSRPDWALCRRRANLYLFFRCRYRSFFLSWEEESPAPSSELGLLGREAAAGRPVVGPHFYRVAL